MQIVPVTMVSCPDCHAEVYGFMCMPELKTPLIVEEAEHGRPEP